MVAIEQRGDVALLRLDDGRELGAKQVILASGYERSNRYLPPAFSVNSSYAIATPPATAPYWRDGALIWEASSPYLYARETADERIIAGGEDENFDDAHRRDALIGTKAGTISAKLAAMLGRGDVPLDCAWAAAFGSSPDGLPAIGRAAGREDVWLASGFGGNGVSFRHWVQKSLRPSSTALQTPKQTCSIHIASDRLGPSRICFWPIAERLLCKRQTINSDVYSI